MQSITQHEIIKPDLTLKNKDIKPSCYYMHEQDDTFLKQIGKQNNLQNGIHMPNFPDG